MRKRAYEISHPWLKFSVDLTRAPASFWAILGECKSKSEHLSGVPLRPDVAKILHGVYLAKGVRGTTAIEGNTLSEEEVLQHVNGKLEVPPSKEYLKQEIDNIVQESNRMLTTIAKGESLDLYSARIKEINRVVLQGLNLEDGVVPGEIRTYSVGVATYRGAPAQDCDYLLDRLCDWLNGPDFEPKAGLEKVHMAILKAIIAHLYIEWIHPFGDGNGRTGRLIELQILIAAGVPSPAGHLMSNHYNETRTAYFAQLKAASESNGDTLPFLTYALTGFLEGLKEQLAYVRTLQFEVAWINYIHDFFKDQNTKASKRKKTLLLEVLEKGEPVPISGIDQLSPKLAKAYAGLHSRTCARDVDSLVNDNLLSKVGKKVEVNRGLIAQFLPICADRYSRPPSRQLPLF